MVNYIRLGKTAHLVPFDTNYNIHNFDCGTNEYNEFLTELAECYHNECTTRTLLLINKKNADVIGYMSLCTGSIKLTDKEKNEHFTEVPPFNSIPTLKIGKLAVSKEYKGKGYGSLLIFLARGLAQKLLDLNIACKFIDVDADIQYDQDLIDFYSKNGFLINEEFKGRNQKTISMRLEFLNLEEAEEQTG